MAAIGTPSVVIRLSDLVDGQEAVCYGALVKKIRGTTARNQPFVRCLFRDKRVQLEAMLWHDHRFFADADSWTEGTAYRLEVRGKHDLRYGMQIELLGIRPATEADAVDGFLSRWKSKIQTAAPEFCRSAAICCNAARSASKLGS